MDEARDLAAAVEGRAGLRYPRELRERLTGYARHGRGQGASWLRLGEELGVPYGTLQRWVGSTERPAGFVTVRSTVAKGEGLALVSPAGWRIEGLSVSDVAALLRELQP